MHRWIGGCAVHGVVIALSGLFAVGWPLGPATAPQEFSAWEKTARKSCRAFLAEA